MQGYNEGTNEEVVGVTWDRKGFIPKVIVSWVCIYIYTSLLLVLSSLLKHATEIYKHGKIPINSDKACIFDP